ncbi:MAG TPA: hypothetical protein VMX35_10445 [Acidobacteriota bacterium]|nr:hypothetical protein [Acidobacteriota bacterium]
MVDALFKGGMLEGDTARTQVESINASLRSFSAAGKEAINALSKEEELSPEACKSIIDKALEEMFSTPCADRAGKKRLGGTGIRGKPIAQGLPPGPFYESL